MLVIAAAAFAVLGIVWLSLGSAIGWVQVALAAVFLAVAFVEGDRRQREDDR
ncbi:MAG: hypothetical protein JWP66_592 [Naasia sp.]|nr:hypothetical protein [Naasia sp.]